MKIKIETDYPDPAPGRGRFAGRHRCPKCSSLVYSRKSLACGICGLPLPEEFRLPEQERTLLAEMLQAERLRHKEWLSRREPSAYRSLSLA